VTSEHSAQSVLPFHSHVCYKAVQTQQHRQGVCRVLCCKQAILLIGVGSRHYACRLADTCVRCIAQHLLSLARDPLFNQLVRDSAESVQNREDVDSVPIIDDIRYHVTLLHGDGELSGKEQCTC